MYYSGRLDAAAIDWCLALEYVLHHKVTCIPRPRRYHAALRRTTRHSSIPSRAASLSLARRHTASRGVERPRAAARGLLAEHAQQRRGWRLAAGKADSLVVASPDFMQMQP